jgi:hypothetical protein
MGEMKRAEARFKADFQIRQEQDAKIGERCASTLTICASIIAAVRLARDDAIDRPSPRINSTVDQSVALARMILDRIVR